MSALNRPILEAKNGNCTCGGAKERENVVLMLPDGRGETKCSRSYSRLGGGKL